MPSLAKMESEPRMGLPSSPSTFTIASEGGLRKVTLEHLKMLLGQAEEDRDQLFKQLQVLVEEYAEEKQVNAELSLSLESVFRRAIIAGFTGGFALGGSLVYFLLRRRV